MDVFHLVTPGVIVVVDLELQSAGAVRLDRRPVRESGLVGSFLGALTIAFVDEQASTFVNNRASAFVFGGGAVEHR